MRGFVWLSLATALALVACGDDSALFSGGNGGGSGGAGASAGSSKGGSPTGGSVGQGAGEGGDAMDAGGAGQDLGGGDGGGTGGTGGTGGGAGAGGGAGTGGLGGGGGAGTGGGGTGGSGGAPATCPGTQVGCVVDWAGQFGTAAGTSTDGTGAAAVFAGNDAVRALTGDGQYLYVAGSNCIRRVKISTAEVETIVGQCGSPEFSNQSGLQARFGALDGMVVSGGTLWVNDAGNFVIREIDLSDMSVTTLSGNVGNNGLQQGSAGQARYDGMLGMTSLGQHLFITEGPGNQDVRRIDSSTGAATLIAGDNGTGAQNGVGTVASFSGARKIGSDGTDLFVVDTENNRVRRIVLGVGGAFTNTVSTLVGAAAGYLDATGTAALFRRPRGITFDGTDLFVADSDNCMIRKIALPGGVVTTIAGSYPQGGCANHAEGLGTAAEFNKPMDIHFDPGSGDLFISEGTVIRRMYL